MDPLHLDPEHIETSANRSPEQNSWGALIAIFVIVAIIVVGAFYAWGKRISEEQRRVLPTELPASVGSASTTSATSSVQ